MRTSEKKGYFIFLLILLMLLLAGCGDSGSAESDKESGNNSKGADGEKITIRIADSFPTTHVASEFGVQPWIDRIEELGEGQIEIEFFPAEQLGKAASLLDGLKNNVSDIAYIGATYYQDQLPLSSVVLNAGLVADAKSGTKAFNRLMQEYLYELEYKDQGIKPLWVSTLNAYQLVTSDAPARKLEDWSGLRLGSMGGIQEMMMIDNGATPVTATSQEMYSLWDRGTINGALSTLMSWPGYQFYDLAEYSTTNASLGSFGIVFAVNEKVWEGWPEEVQKVVTQASEEIMQIFPEELINVELELQKEYEAMGIEFFELEEEELNRWNEAMQTTNSTWAENMEKRNLPGIEVLEKFKQYNEEYQK